MYAKRTDANQKEIVDALRRIGASVYVTSHVGKNFPDLVVGFRNRNFLFEIKAGHASHAKQKLSEGQLNFMQTWHGQIHVITSITDALDVMNCN